METQPVSLHNTPLLSIVLCDSCTGICTRASAHVHVQKCSCELAENSDVKCFKFFLTAHKQKININSNSNSNGSAW